jgi:hypothetical protein
VHPSPSTEKPAQTSGGDAEIANAIEHARQLFLDDEETEAEILIRNALSNYGEHSELLYELASLERYKDDFESAITHYERLTSSRILTSVHSCMQGWAQFMLKVDGVRWLMPNSPWQKQRRERAHITGCSAEDPFPAFSKLVGE